MAEVKRPPVGINPNIPIPVQRELRKVAGFAFDAQDKAGQALDGLSGKVGKSEPDLLEVSKFVSAQVQAGGQYPINLTGLISSGVSGTVTLLKLTGGGSNGSLTFQNGLITAFVAPT